MDGAGRAVVVQDHRVVELARFGGAAPDAIVARRAQLGVREQRGDAVEIAPVEAERVLVDERRDLVDVAHSSIGIRE